MSVCTDRLCLMDECGILSFGVVVTGVSGAAWCHLINTQGRHSRGAAIEKVLCRRGGLLVQISVADARSGKREQSVAPC